MADRPILFSAPMVRALLAGTKTQTRRILKPQPMQGYAGDTPYFSWGGYTGLWPDDWHDAVTKNVKIAPGDRLWVRETWAPLTYLTHNDPGPQAIIDGGFYRADDGTVDGEVSKWKPSIFMPRHASRLTLTVTDVRVERLQDISETDALAEGIDRVQYPEFADWGWPQRKYFELWDAINGEGAAQSNPWVAAYTFTVHHQNIDQIDRRAA